MEPTSALDIGSGNDSADLATFCRRLYIGGAGDVKLTTIDGQTVTLKAVPVGTVIELGIKKVFVTGSSATLMIGFY